MARWEKYGTRDLGYSQWHRQLPSWARMIDLDHIEYCPHCYDILALVEAAQDVGQEVKATTVLRSLAERAGVPAYLVFWEKAEDGTVRGFRVGQVSPQFTVRRNLTSEEYAEMLRRLHVEHDLVCRAIHSLRGEP